MSALPTPALPHHPIQLEYANGMVPVTAGQEHSIPDPGGAELRLDWDRSYLASMKYCLRFEEETSTSRHCLLGAEQALQLLDTKTVSSSPYFAIQVSI